MSGVCLDSPLQGQVTDQLTHHPLESNRLRPKMDYMTEGTEQLTLTNPTLDKPSLEHQHVSSDTLYVDFVDAPPKALSGIDEFELDNLVRQRIAHRFFLDHLANDKDLAHGSDISKYLRNECGRSSILFYNLRLST
jgi:hypothetical protein